jgi:hypothetical protein
VLWAQRSSATEEAKNLLFVTIRIPDCKNVKIDLTETHLHLESDSEDSDNHYLLDIDLYQPVDPSLSHHTHNGNSIHYVIRKKDKQEEYWPRLTKEKAKFHYIKTDFDKWVDEDEQDEHEEELDQAAMPPLGGDNMWENMIRENPQLAQLGALNGGDFNLPEGLGEGSINTSEATEKDFSSSDEEDGDEGQVTDGAIQAD